MSQITDLFQLASELEHTMQALCTLGIEYQEKAITTERFAERVHGILVQYQQGRRVKQAEPQQDADGH